ncbi:ABC transporter substrate-binding protein [uncultured Microbacterium sp.]|uniref:ABC transporter substrate-binding protein n=1 Tax=uncultured Microbacterium sp. TaxID=191216 RepID=UPI0035CA2078
MTTRRPFRISLAVTAAAVTVFYLSACSATPTAASAGAAGASSAASPITVTNCATEVTLDKPAQRIVMVNNDALANVEVLGAVDRVVALTVTPQPGLYDDATYDTLDSLGLLSTETNSTGGSIVSRESILAADPDLVIAPENAVDRAALAASGIAVYSPSAYCTDPGPELREKATFDRVWDEVRTLGALLGESQRADDEIASATNSVSDPAPDAGTAAALYVSSGGSVLSPYGAPSMVTPVFAAAGLTNVYADSDERVFDANIEDIISRDPHTIVLLYGSGDPQDTIDAFLSAPGVSALSAVKDHRVVALKFAYTDPPSMLSIQGPAQLSALLAALA